MFFTAVNLLNYLDRNIISALGPSMQRELSLSDGQFGTLGAAFTWGFVLTSPLLGQFVRFASRRSLFFWSLVVWSLATAATGYFSLFSVLLLIRMVVGMAQAIFSGLIPTVIDDIVAARWKSRALGVLLAAFPVGASLGYILGGVLDSRVGWRASFIIAASLSLPFILGHLFIPRLRSADADGGGGGMFNDWRSLWYSKRYRFAVLGFIAQTFAISGFAYWAPTYIHRVIDFPLDRGSVYLGAILIFTGLAGTLTGGWLAKNRPGADNNGFLLRKIALLTALTIPLTLLMLSVPNPAVFFICTAGIEMLIFMTFAPMNLVLLTSVPHRLRVSAMGISMLTSSFFGNMLGIWLIGVASTASNNLMLAMQLLTVALAINTIALWCSARFPPPAKEGVA